MEALSTELTWNDVDRLSGLLARHLPGAAGVAAFDRVVGISRGGLVPAVLVASLLRVKRVESVQVRLYDGDTRLPEPVLLGSAPAPAGPSGEPARTLVVDEILDSGRTMAFLRTILPRASLAVLVARLGGRRPATEGAPLKAYACGEDGAAVVWTAAGIETREWILFPWSPPEDRQVRDEGP